MPRVFVTFEDLYQEIAEQARENNITGQEQWNELVDEVIDGYVDMGEMNPDQDTEGYKIALARLLSRFKKEEAEEESSPKEDIVPERYAPDQSDEFDAVEDFEDIIRKENEGF